MKYAFIGRHKKDWPIVMQCRVLEVSVSGFGQYRARQSASASPTVGGLNDTALLVHIRAIFHEMKARTAGRASGANWPRAGSGRARSACENSCGSMDCGRGLRRSSG
jgi:hypothetical protein